MFIISVGKRRRKGEGWTKEDCRALHTVNHSQFTVLPVSDVIILVTSHTAPDAMQLQYSSHLVCHTM